MDMAASFIGFDELDRSTWKKGGDLNKVMLIGSDGRFDVLAIEDDKIRPLGCLEGLNGTVIGAKMLPSGSRVDMSSALRPLVALIIHGPEMELQGPTRSAEAGRLSDDLSDHSDILPGIPNVSTPAGVPNTNQVVAAFQTRIEVYSLASQTYVATLLVSQPAALLPNFAGLPSIPPPPIGNFKLEANGSFVVVSSGNSGEVFIFASPADNSAAFQCLGKTWTSSQFREHRRYSNSSTSTETDSSPVDGPRGYAADETPITALSDRWLATAPPMSPKRSSIRAIIPQSVGAKRALGLDSHNASSPPSTTCLIDTPDEESMLNKVARGVAQEFVKGARWIGDQGLQTWNQYWNKDAISPSQGSDTRRGALSPERHQYFPPTHAPEASAVASGDPELVSIIDLKRLQDARGSKSSALVSPLATFQPPGGCSFLSFAPGGLIIMTASKKGDVQYIWDLMQITKCRAALLLAEAQEAGDQHDTSVSPRVRQVARYSRLTSSSIVDVIWSIPPGEKLAMITRNGTVHLFDMPTSAFQWPPSRRVLRAAPSQVMNPTSAVPSSAETNESSSGPLASALRLVGKSQPILANLRGRTPSVGNAFSSASAHGVAAATGLSSRAVAAGLTRSVGAATGTVQTMRRAGETRLHIAGLARFPTPSRVTWLGSNDKSSIVLIDGENLKRYRVRRSTSTDSRLKRRSTFLDGRGIEVRLPSLSHLSTVAASNQSDEIGHFENEGSLRGYWSLSAAGLPMGSKSNSHPLSHAEIETNPPYQPFHSDRRVNLFTYPTDSESAVFQPQTTNAWVFGNDIPTVKLNLRPPRQDDDDDDELGGNPNAHTIASGMVENRVTIGGIRNHDEKAMEEIVITSKRRRPGLLSASATGTVDEDGFFEDDCDVLDFAADRV